MHTVTRMRVVVETSKEHYIIKLPKNIGLRQLEDMYRFPNKDLSKPVKKILSILQKLIGEGSARIYMYDEY